MSNNWHVNCSRQHLQSSPKHAFKASRALLERLPDTQKLQVLGSYCLEKDKHLIPEPYSLISRKEMRLKLIRLRCNDGKFPTRATVYITSVAVRE